MLQVLHMGLHVCQMMGYPQIDSGLDLITHNSARTFGLSDYGIATGNPANLVILPAESGFEAVRCQVPQALVDSSGAGDCHDAAGADVDPDGYRGEEVSFARNSPSA